MADNLGTVRTLLDSEGNRIRDLVFAAWGEITQDTNPSLDFPFAFTGREYDRETGLYFYRARYYDPRTGRFISEDPIGFAAGDTNLNRYVANSPSYATDPTGLQEREKPEEKPENQQADPPAKPKYPKPNQLEGVCVFGVYDDNDRIRNQLKAMLRGIESCPAKDWKGLMRQVRKYYRKNGPILMLFIADHGMIGTNDLVGVMMFGKDKLSAEQFEALKPYLAEDAVVVLLGCFVGNNPEYCRAVADSCGAFVLASNHCNEATDVVASWAVWTDGRWIVYAPTGKEEEAPDPAEDLHFWGSGGEDPATYDRRRGQAPRPP